MEQRTTELVPAAAESLEMGEAHQRVADRGRGGVSPDEFVYPRGHVLLLLTVGIMTAVLMVALDNYILAAAIPRITTQFNSLNEVAWYASSYFLTQMALQPVFGQMYTDFQIKFVYMGAVLIFEIGSIVCATARTSLNLIAGRLIAGAGGGGIYVGTLTMMSYAVAIDRRPLYLAGVTSMFGVASVAGPLLGGVFTDSERLTWRFCFWVNLPIGFLANVLIWIFFKSPALKPAQDISLKSKLGRLDIIGACLLISGFVCLLLALQWAGITYPWSDSRIWGCLLGFGLLVTAFIILQLRKKDQASFPLRLISQRTVGAGSLFMLFIQLSVGILIYYLPFYFQAVLATDTVDSGIRNLPFLITLLFAPILSGGLISLFGFYVPFMWLGAILLTIGAGLLASLRVNSSAGELIGYQILAGLGAGMCNQIPFNAVQYILPRDKIIMGSAIVSFCNSLGPVLGISIAQAIFANIFLQQLRLIPTINAAALIYAGPKDLGDMVPKELLVHVRGAYDYALTKTYILAAAGGGLAFCCSLAMEWRNIKEERKG